MKRKIVLVLLGLLLVGGLGSAVMLQYLAWNTAKISYEISEYPVVFTTSIDGITYNTNDILFGHILGGESKSIWINTTSQANSNITGTIEYTVMNPEGIICDELQINDLDCVATIPNTITFEDNKTWDIEETKIEEITFVTNPKAFGKFNVTIVVK